MTAISDATGLREEFAALCQELTAIVRDRPLDAGLREALEARFPADGTVFQRVKAVCLEAIEAGWMCDREAGGIRYSRVHRPSADLAGFSVDVVDMTDVVGPYHRHPKGEIDMVMPIDPTARFDDCGEGWFVYGPETAHPPTVAGGRALVLYLLPDGAIEFTQS